MPVEIQIEPRFCTPCNKMSPHAIEWRKYPMVKVTKRCKICGKTETSTGKNTHNLNNTKGVEDADN